MQERLDRGTPPGTPSRRFPGAVISQNIPPQISSTNMRQYPMPSVPDLETTGVRPPPPRGLGLPEGGQDLIGQAAGALPPPPVLQLIEKLLQQRNEAQGIPGRALGGKVEKNQPYIVGERGPETFVPDRPGTIVADASGSLPAGAKFDEEPVMLPPGAKFDDESTSEKAARVFQNVKPEGPISGLLSLIRTAGQAAKGQRPDLLVNPEGAIPEAVQGAVAGTGARAVGTMARTPRYSPRAEPAPTYKPPQEPLQLTSRLSPEEAGAQVRSEKLAAAQQEAKRVAQGLRDTGQMPAESSGAPIEMGGPVTSPPPPSPLLPAQLVREFGAVRKGVELKERLNPGSEQNLSAKEKAMQAAIRPHIESINTVGQRSQAPIAALEAALPSMSEALSTPGKAASVANWVRVYERAARAKFTSQAKASLDLATRNLNNNLGTDLTLKDVLRGE